MYKKFIWTSLIIGGMCSLLALSPSSVMGASQDLKILDTDLRATYEDAMATGKKQCLHGLRYFSDGTGGEQVAKFPSPAHDGKMVHGFAGTLQIFHKQHLDKKVPPVEIRDCEDRREGVWQQLRAAESNLTRMFASREAILKAKK